MTQIGRIIADLTKSASIRNIRVIRVLLSS